MSNDDFIEAYCLWVPVSEKEYLSLRERPNYDCVFWVSGCAVYEHRPLQCKSYPFWEGILRSRADWEAEAKECPGIGKGPLRGAEEILAWLKARAEAEYLTR
jgi:uncharacterized protein